MAKEGASGEPARAGTWIRLCVAAAITAALSIMAGVFVTGSAVADQPAQTDVYPPWGFGGYTWLGDVSEISADWSVPIIDPTSSQSHASTWLGAQSNTGESPFIQVGTLEDAGRTGYDYYSAFWSDSAMGFHPQLLGPVWEGDVVSAQMSQVESGWRLTLRDTGANRTYDITVPFAAGQTLTQAEWTQEDPSPSGMTSVDLPYPKTSTVTFDDVEVNHSVPSLNITSGQALMASGGSILIPGPFQSDSFSLVSPVGVSKQYLEDVNLMASGSAKLDVAMNFWGGESASERQDLAQGAAQGVRAQLNAFSVLRVPTAAHGDLHALENQLRAILVDYSTWMNSGLKLYGRAYDTLESDGQNLTWYGDQVRSDIGLPPA
jgi:hypothetical protein